VITARRPSFARSSRASAHRPTTTGTSIGCPTQLGSARGGGGASCRLGENRSSIAHGWSPRRASRRTEAETESGDDADLDADADAVDDADQDYDYEIVGG
jgi:hypothetical protein